MFQPKIFAAEGTFQPNQVIEQNGYGVKPWAWLPAFTNPLFSYVGAGLFPTFRWQIYHRDPAWVNQSVPITGAPGIQTGSVVLQPLLDTRAGINGL